MSHDSTVVWRCAVNLIHSIPLLAVTWFCTLGSIAASIDVGPPQDHLNAAEDTYVRQRQKVTAQLNRRMI